MENNTKYKDALMKGEKACMMKENKNELIGATRISQVTT